MPPTFLKKRLDSGRGTIWEEDGDQWKWGRKTRKGDGMDVTSILNMCIHILINMIILYNEYAQVKMPTYSFHSMSKSGGFTGKEVFLCFKAQSFQTV